MSRLAGTLRLALRDVVTALRVAPVEVAVGVALAVTWSINLAADFNDAQAWLEIATLCVLAGGIAWIFTLLHHRGVLSATRRWLFTLAGFAAVVVYDLTLLDFNRETEGWRAVLLLATVVVAIALVPLVGAPPGDERDRRFREFDVWMGTRLTRVLLYAGALYLGLVFALAAINGLFELHMDEKVYGHLFGAIAFGLAPWIFVGGAPEAASPPTLPERGVRGLRWFGVFLFVPLFVIYYLILYAYMVRIAVTGELPRNLASPLAMLAGLVGAVGVMMFASHGERAPWAIKLAPPLFLPLGVLGIWAIHIRVAQYGWTEFRYLRVACLVALLILAGLGSWALLRRRPLRAYAVPLVLGAVGLLSALGPWSASATARRSQQARLATILRVAEVDTAAIPATPRPVPDTTYDEIRSIGTYLADGYGRGAVAAVAGHTAVPETSHRRPRSMGDLAEALGLDRQATTTSRVDITARLAGGLPVETLDDGELYFVNVPASARREVSGTWDKDGTTLRLNMPGRILVADLADLAARTLSSDSTAAFGDVVLRPASATLPLRDANGRDAGQLVVRWLRVGSDSVGVRVRELEGLLVVRPRVSP